MPISVYALACYSLLTNFHLADYLFLGNREEQAPGRDRQRSCGAVELQTGAHGQGFTLAAAMSGALFFFSQ